MKANTKAARRGALTTETEHKNENPPPEPAKILGKDIKRVATCTGDAGIPSPVSNSARSA